MSMLSKARKLSTVAMNPHIVTCETKYLFILSHMRSRSSVVSHVLGSNPDICGYSELQQSYSGRLDLLRMRAEIYQESQSRLSNKFMLDKLLHDHCLISDEIFRLVQPKVIFLIREPESTIKSMINLGRRTGVAEYQNPERVGQYYCSRLHSLEYYAGKVAGDYFFIDADDVVSRTEGVLASLTNWLGLQTPLEKNYSSFQNTGKRQRGDSSDNIKSGVIKSTKAHPNISIPRDVLLKAEASYRSCKRHLLTNDGTLHLVKRSA